MFDRQVEDADEALASVDATCPTLFLVLVFLDDDPDTFFTFLDAGARYAKEALPWVTVLALVRLGTSDPLEMGRCLGGEWPICRCILELLSGTSPPPLSAGDRVSRLRAFAWPAAFMSGLPRSELPLGPVIPGATGGRPPNIVSARSDDSAARWRALLRREVPPPYNASPSAPYTTPTLETSPL